MLPFTSRRPLTADEPFLSDAYHLITAGTFQKRALIQPDSRKEMLLESLDFNCYKSGWRLLAYVILDNHYHLIVETPARDHSRMAHIIQSAHSFSAYHWRREDPTIRSRIWWNYWDTPIDHQESLLRHINWVHLNPASHRLTGDFGRYRWSSRAAYLELDSSALQRWERDYPPTDLNVIDNF